MSHDLFWTTVATAAVLLGNVIISSLLARRGATDVFGPFNLAKRIGAGVLPAATLGVLIGMVRFIAAAPDERSQTKYVWISVLTGIAMTCLVTLLLLVFPGSLADLFLGSDDTQLLWATWAYTVGLVANGLMYSTYRGRMQQDRANWTYVVGMAGVPLAVVLLAPQSWNGTTLLFAVAAGVIGWSSLSIATFVAQGIREHFSWESVKSSIGEMLAYSMPRVPGTIAMAFILAVGPIAAQRGGAPLAASYLLAGMAVAQLGSASMAAFSQILLPRVSEMHSGQRNEEIRLVCSRVIFLIIALSVFSVPHLYVASESLVRVWLGSEFMAGSRVIQIVTLSIPPLIAHSVLQSITNAVMARPVSTYTALIGLALTTFVSFASAPENAELIAYGFVIGQWAAGLGLTSALFFRFRPTLPWGYVSTLALLGVGSAALAALLRAQYQSSLLGSFLTLGVALAVIVLGVVGGLWFSPPELGIGRAIARSLRIPRAET